MRKFFCEPLYNNLQSGEKTGSKTCAKYAVNCVHKEMGVEELTCVYARSTQEGHTHTQGHALCPWKHWLSSDKGKVEGWKTETFHCLFLTF